ncbi:MAG: L,D-transpeptidase family protein [Candidatus Adiutrix sp.]|jgi:murein L,D-transpeptidase YafK|nr:L,D-transpeptidase family protein [Candidatus Adiutrix sp.]
MALLLAPAVSRAWAADEGMLPDALLYPGSKPGYILVVDKAEQMLYLYRHDGAGNIGLDRVMPCSTGENKGDKMTEGDKKTPNGFYIFNQKLLPAELAPIYGILAYPTDYPNFWDKKQGHGGHGIWIHGINKPMVNYDSNGCVELENAEIARMEELIRLYDTPMVIYESLTLASLEDQKAEAEAIKSFVETWRRAWAAKDHQTYQSLYDPTFVNSDDRSFAAWMAHKVKVGQGYRSIGVELKDLRIYRHREVIAVLFEQDYSGDKRFASIGLKRLYLKKSGQTYKIVGEDYRDMPETETRKWLTAEEKRRAIETPAIKATPPLMAAKAPESPAAPAPPPVPEATPEPPAAEKDDPAAAEAQAAAKAKAAAEGRAARAALEAEIKPEILGLVNQWAEAWSRRDSAAYFQFYHPDFYYQAKKLNLGGFIKYRQQLIEEADEIEVRLSAIEVRLMSADTARVIFRQDYRSDNTHDLGRKTLTLKKTESGWKIVAETWKAV